MPGYFTDTYDTFCTDLAITTTAVATDCIPTPATTSGANATVAAYGDGTAPWVEITVTEAFTASGAATATFDVMTADTEGNLTSGTVLVSSGAIGKASLTLGTKVWLRLPADGFKAVYGLKVTVATGPMTAGKITAAVTPRRPVARYYDDGSVIQ